MIISIINFAWISVSSFLWGFLFANIISNILERKGIELDIVIALGLAGLTVYAELFSLLHRIGLLASIGIFLADIVILWKLRKEIKAFLISLFGIKHIGLIFWGSILIFAYFSMLACKTPDFYDTGLYHAQAIRWIEEYGVVKGLGNLHNRLAYNSAFLCLQALFSWKSVLGISLHGMNAFLGALATIYALINVLYTKKEKLFSLFVDVLILLYIILNMADIPSPNTDFSAMMILLYIFSKWLHGIQKENLHNISGILCIIIVWGITVKLSIAALGLFVLYTFICYLKKGQWKKILAYSLFMITVAVPFLARNFIISGFLLYPYSTLDLFDVDWKMPEYTVNFDNQEIIAWGRGLNDVDKYDWPFKEWFPIWFSQLEGWNALLVIINIGLVMTGLLWWSISFRKKTYRSVPWEVWGVSIACIITWLFSAPLLRYGMVYLYLPPFILLGFIITGMKRSKIVTGLKMLILGLAFVGYISHMRTLKGISVYYPNDYPHFLCYEAELNGERIYLPTEGDKTGYHAFPSTPYSARIDVIEKRGRDLKNGFKVKEEYKDTNISTYGDIY